MELLIVEKNGWSKPVKIARAITRVGSAPSNDIQLQSTEIAPVQIQILYSSDLASSCKVVNLAQQISARVAHETRQLPTYTAVDIHDGDEILLGDHSITFRMPLSADVMQSATMIHAALSFPDAILKHGYVTTGLLTIKNNGEQSACQFQVELNGLPSDCFQIDPIPLMYAGAQEELRIRIYHRGLYPLAGIQTIVLKVTAPESYPGEELIIRQGIYVAPVFKQTLDLADDMSVAAKLYKNGELTTSSDAKGVITTTPPGADEHRESESANISTSEPLDISNFEAQQELPERSVQKQNVPVASRPVQDLSKLKVVRGPADADNFWDDK